MTDRETDASELLARLAEDERLLDAAYRSVARSFGMPDCAMWVLYFLAIADDPLTQQGLCDLMMYPKQTVNSAVTKLKAQGLVELAPASGMGHGKHVVLTKAGAEAAKDTVLRLRAAEERALASMGREAMARFSQLYRQFREAVQAELASEGFIDAQESGR